MFQDIEFDQSEENWFFCSVKDETFEGAGGSMNFPEILSSFRHWVENENHFSSSETINKILKEPESLNIRLLFLINWFYQQCDEDWEHSFGVSIWTIEKPGWHVFISVEETELEDKQFQNIATHRTEQDWVKCSIENKAFVAEGGPFNLPELLQIFQAWAES